MSRNVNKKAVCAKSGAPGSEDLERINRFSRKKLTEQEVYTFSVRLCDNEVDRDGERFEPETLEGLAELFVGRTGIFDHNWSAAGQTARIYRAQVVTEPETLTAAGDPYCYVKGEAYLLRTPGNQELIAQLDGGILREVSVGCAVEKSVCSICGRQAGTCEHEKGNVYDGKLCYVSLQGAADAFEWSFVAVPAQPRAGVMKALRQDGRCWKERVREDPAGRVELEQLEKQAMLGRRYLDTLRREVVRLAGLAQDGVDLQVMESIAKKLEESELLELRRAYSQRAGERFPVAAQLPYERRENGEAREDGAFLI